MVDMTTFLRHRESCDIMTDMDSLLIMMDRFLGNDGFILRQSAGSDLFSQSIALGKIRLSSCNSMSLEFLGQGYNRVNQKCFSFTLWKAIRCQKD